MGRSWHADEIPFPLGVILPNLDNLCDYRLHGGELLHSQIWPLIWENSVGVDQAAVWRFPQDEGAAPGRAAVVVRAEFPGLACAL